MPRIKYSALAILAFLISTFIITAAPPGEANAASFNPGNIITDAAMGNYNSMNEASINSFLRSKCNRSACLGYQNIGGESAAHIIYRAAQDFHINPQVLIVLLQKEQSLITTNATSTRLRKATGYGCPDSAACDSKYYGFKNQVRLAANLFRTVLNGGWSNYPVGWRYIHYHPNSACGGSSVYIANRATSAFYRYTPYQPNSALLSGRANGCSSYGNYNFFNYFTSWFGSTGSTSPTNTTTTVFTPPAMNSVYLSEGTFALKSTSGKSLTFDSMNNGAQARINRYTGSTAQQFTLVRSGNFYKIRHVASGRYLDVNGASITNGTKVQLWDGNDTCAQKWAVEIYGEHYTFRSACSGRALDINGGAISNNGTIVQIWDNNHTAAQQWDLINLTHIPISDGEYNLKTTGGTVLSLDREYLTNGTPIKTGLSTAARTQLFQFTRRADGYYVVKNPSSGRYLDVNGAGTANGTQVQLWDGNNTCAQRWIIERPGRVYRLRNACSGKSLDVNGGDVQSDDIKVQIYNNNGTDAQKWYFTTRPTTRYIADGTYAIRLRSSNGYVVAPDQSSTPYDGLNVSLQYELFVNRSHRNSQNLTLTYNSYTGYYTIRNPYTGRALDVNGAGRTSGTNIQFWSYNNSCAQQWLIVPAGSDYYKILSACSRLALSRASSNIFHGDNILLRAVTNTYAQEWYINRK